MKLKKYKTKNKIFILLIIISIIFTSYLIYNNMNDKKMIDLSNLNETQIKDYCKKNKIDLDIEYKYSDKKEGKLIYQNIEPNTNINTKLKVVISKGIAKETYKEFGVNELGKIPIMMYHGISNLNDSDTVYTKGNVDISGYNRTKESFIRDLEFYYSSGYQMIRLIDFVNGNISTDIGKTPILLTFDDGNTNNFRVLGIDKNNNLEIDPNCAIGILENFKKKYPDYKVTATFFLNDNLFNQKEYDSLKLTWLINNGYDVGNHTKTHANLEELSKEEVFKEVGYMYNKFEKIIKDKYVPIVALPFGKPSKKTHENFQYILKGNYESREYNTISTLRVGWEPNVSPYSNSFDKEYLKRVRAWDNDGKDFDIEMVFNDLKKTRYVSDGDADTITLPVGLQDKVVSGNKKVITY